MSTGERGNILEYLPEEHKRKVLELVKRLQEETEAREKYQGLYLQTQQELNSTTLKCNQLKDENKLLKEQIHNSFSIVSQVRANFHANRKKSPQPAQGDHSWEDDSEQSDEENHQNSVNKTKINPPKVSTKSPLEQYRPPMTTSKKQNVLNMSSNEANSTQLNSSRSKEIVDLKKQIRNMQEGKRREEQNKKQIAQKLRLVDEIKSRYRSGEQSLRKSTDSVKESVIERIDISNTFEQEEASSHSREKPKGVIPAEKSSNKKQVGIVVQTKTVHSRYKSPGKGHVITSEDYDDVLDLINCNNL